MSLQKRGYNLEIWYTLPVLPDGLTADGINAINIGLTEGVNFTGFNVMTMDYGDSAAPNPKGKMAEYGIQAITSLQKQLKTVYTAKKITKTDDQLWSMIGTTPMIGMNDITTEIFDLQDAKETVTFANSKNIGMISMWSLNRDVQCSGGAANYVSISCSSIVQKPYEFSTTFNAYNDISKFKPDAGGGGTGGGGTGGGGSTTGVQPWSSTKIYFAGDRATYNGKTYEAKWWTQGNQPDKATANEWENPWKLIG